MLFHKPCLQSTSVHFVSLTEQTWCDLDHLPLESTLTLLEALVWYALYIFDINKILFPLSLLLGNPENLCFFKANE